jgi:ketosteroid isomerase-like protein
MVDPVGLATKPAETLAVARRLFDAFEKGGTDAIVGLLHPDVRARPGIDGAPMLEGRVAVVEWWADMERRGTEIEARPLAFELQGDVVIVRGYLRHRNGRALSENQVFWLYEIHDGLITLMESHPSRAAALAAAAA